MLDKMGTRGNGTSFMNRDMLEEINAYVQGYAYHGVIGPFCIVLGW